MNRLYPFFIIVDDGGFSHILLNGEGLKISFDAYQNILCLAEEFGIRIPIAFTTSFLDLNNLSQCGKPVDYASDLIDFMKEHSAYLEFADHGLTHQFEKYNQEFFITGQGIHVPYEIQDEKVAKSALIYKDIGVHFPSIFVPPGHGWEEGVTDKIYAKYGAKYLVSVDKEKNVFNKSLIKSPIKLFKLFTPLHVWRGSSYLKFLPRIDMGINNTDSHLNITKLKIAKKWIIPTDIFSSTFLHRTLLNLPYHSYMAHIGNFMTKENYEWWRKLFQWIQRNPKLIMPSDNKMAIDCYEKALTGFNSIKI